MAHALAIDDSSEILDELEERLTSLKDTCDKASCQEQAEQMLRDRQYDYVFLDACIPMRYGGIAQIQYGKNLLQQIKQTYRIPIIVMTAHELDGPKLAVEMMELGADSFVAKPFTKDPPEEKIRRVLGKYKGAVTTQTQSSASNNPFNGGYLILSADGIELCEVEVGQRSSSLIRRILELLRQKDKNGKYQAFSGQQLADKLALERGQNAVAEAIKGFRDHCSERLRDEKGIICGKNDVIANVRNGYHLTAHITVCDEREPDQKSDLSDLGAAMLRQIKKHGSQTIKQLDSKLQIPMNKLKKELGVLEQKGFIERTGNGTAAGYRMKNSSASWHVR